MARYCGVIGYAETVETKPGIWDEVITERMYYGELLRNNRSLQAANQANDNISISNEISILADPYAYQNFHAIRYLEFMGTKWKVSNISVQDRRLVLTTGGIYNGD